MRKREKKKSELQKEQSSLDEILNLTELNNHEQLINSPISSRPISPAQTKTRVTISFAALVTYLES